MKRLAFLVGAASVALACAQVPEVQGKQVYQEHCAACHGTTGVGDGPVAAEMPIKPADLTRLSVNNGGVFPEAQVISKIHGYPGRNHQALMPEFDVLTAGPRAVWTSPEGAQVTVPADLLAVVDYLKTLQDVPG
ncbi:MAG: c-type cytochrome [Paracoccaceae bacterium]